MSNTSQITTGAFINSKYTKAEAVALAKLHREQDSYIKGTYGQNTPNGWKGCSVGCMAKGKHSDYPELFGIDTRIAYLSDKFFENLPAPEYKDWTVKLFESVKEGVDTTKVWYRFNHWLLLDEEHGVIRFNKDPSISTIGNLLLKVAEGENVTIDQWLSARKNAYTAAAAAYAAYAAAYAAAYDAAAYAAAAYDAAAYAAAAADTAYAAAAAAAYAAAYAADTAAAYAADTAAYARIKHYQVMVDKLCYFLSGGI